MKTNLTRYQEDLERLIKLSDQMHLDFALLASGKGVKKGTTKPGEIFFSLYQQWYSEAFEVIRQILPNRLKEFELLYQGSDKRNDINAQTCTIKDWLLGIRSSVDVLSGRKQYEDASIAFMRLQMQCEILKSARLCFESSLLDIRQILRADLVDSEAESARELLKNGFLRTAGAVAGVVTEKHLSEVCQNHNVSISRKNLTIADYNDALKKEGAIDIPQWRTIQRLGDLRNLCDHNREREPTKDAVTELIDGVEKLTKTLL
jgi:hypothetical protein